MKRSLIFAVCAFLFSVPAFPAEFFVAPDPPPGLAPTGSLDLPFGTLEEARDAIRDLKARNGGVPPAGVTVWLRGGFHHRTAPFELSAEDSGTPDRPIVYRARAGEQPRLVGGLPLDPADFQRVTPDDPLWPRLDQRAATFIHVLNLREYTSDFGSLDSRAHAAVNEALELFVDGRPMTLARFPDAVEFDSVPADLPPSQPIPGWLRTGAVSDGQTTFSFTGDRPRRWRDAADPWLLGYWGAYWDARNARLTHLDLERRLIVKSRTSYATRPGQPYFAYNLIEELTEPGEYYLDRGSGRLYFRPPSGQVAGELFVSVLAAPMIRLHGASHVAFDGLSFEFVRGDLFHIDGGEGNSISNAWLANCGGRAAVIGGTRNGIERCEVAHTGAAGVVLNGGDRATLTSAENYVRNTSIHHVGRIFWTYQPGIEINGCGNRVEHCEIIDAPHAGILQRGNRHVVEFSVFGRLCQWVSDMGSLYTGRDWGFRDNIIRYNCFLAARSPFGPDQHGVYLDDCVSGLTIFGNVFYETSQKKSALMVGGGRDNIIENNIFANNGIGIHLDDRGRSRITNKNDSWDLLQKIIGMNYREEPWLSAYPSLAVIPATWAEIQSTHWLLPEGNIFRRNIHWQGKAFDLRVRPESNVAQTNTFADNLEGLDPLFVDEPNVDLNLRPDSPAFQIPGFEPIPFDQIGIERQN